MSNTNAVEPSRKQKVEQDLREFGLISAYLAFFFCALTTYTMLLLKEYGAASYLNYAFALINALVVGKVILLGEMAHVGRKGESRPLYQTAIYKAFMFCLLVLAFHFVEEFIKRLIHGGAFGTVIHEIRFDDLIGRSVIVFAAFIPLFGFRELRRILGNEKFRSLIFKG